MKGFDALNATQKKLCSLQSTISEKVIKNWQKWFFKKKLTSQKLTTPLKMSKNQKQKYFCEHNYKCIKNPDVTCLKGWIKIIIPLLGHP